MSTDAPTLAQLRQAWIDEEAGGIEFIAVETEPDDHGYAYTRIFKRASDDTYWAAYGVNQASGDYDTLRDDCKTSTEAADRVYPHTVTKTEYRNKP